MSMNIALTILIAFDCIAAIAFILTCCRYIREKKKCIMHEDRDDIEYDYAKIPTERKIAYEPYWKDAALDQSEK